MTRAHSATGYEEPRSFMLNMESVYLTDDQFYGLCRDNPDLRLELTAKRELVIMSPDKRVYIYRPGQPVECLENPTSVSGEPELPGLVFEPSEIW